MTKKVDWDKHKKVIAGIRKLKPAKSAQAALTRMRRLLADPLRWGKGGLGIDEHGSTISGDHHLVARTDRRVCSFCLLGGAYCVSGPAEDEVVQRLALAATRLYGKRIKRDYQVIKSQIENGEVPDGPVMAFNDHKKTTHAEVLRLIDYAKTITLPKAA